MPVLTKAYVIDLEVTAVDQRKSEGMLSSLFSRLIACTTAIAGIALIALVAVAGADIIGRTLFNWPVEGSSTIISEFLFPLTVFFSLPMLAQTAGHIRVDLADRALIRFKKFVGALFGILSFAFWGIIAWQAGGRSIEAFVLDQRPIGAIGIPAVYSYGIVALGAGLGGIAHLVWMYRRSSDTVH